MAIFVLSYQKCYVCLIISYSSSSTKLKKRTDQVLPRSEGVAGRVRAWRQGREMAQTVYAHMNK
jgi:hypothetical protein